MEQFLVPAGEGASEYMEKKSRFLGLITPVTTEAEARARLEAVKKQEYDARHDCWAYILHSGQKRYSDDGEPQGTAGQPILNVLEREGVQDVLCIVTRYFGGIKLGTGGLVRAYTSSAKLGLEAAGICDVCERQVMTYALDYTYLAKLQNLAGGALFTIENLTYADVVQAELSCVPERADEVKNLIANLTGGQGRLCSEALTSCAKYDERIT